MEVVKKMYKYATIMLVVQSIVVSLIFMNRFFMLFSKPFSEILLMISLVNVALPLYFRSKLKGKLK